MPGVRAALAGPGVAVLSAPPGAGKTTVLPLRLLDEPWLAGRIVMLEPRRLAARAAARRMAFLLGEDVGATAGYTTRDDRRVSRDTRIEVVTEGVLTRRLQRDPSLPGVGLVVLDEFHERGLQADLALALLVDARPVLRPDLRLLVMSATLDVDAVAAVLTGASGPGGPGPAPVVSSEGRAWPVEVRWVPPPPRTATAAAAERAVRRAVREEEGDLLVFLPGAAEIRRVEALLARDPALAASGVDVRPLFGALPAAAQDAALAPSPPGRRRVVLATDIAETSLTVAGVRVVVDAGLARTPRYDPRRGLSRLQTGPASRASADQRAGRAGRTGPGVAYRLWSKVEHAARRPFREPEIMTADLAGLALELAVWGSEPEGLAFLDRPPAGALAEARGLLRELGALDTAGRPTAAGRAMADLPVHPRLARMVMEAAAAGGPAGWTACLLAALLEDRGVVRGAPDGLPVDVGDSLRVLAGRPGPHPRADAGAVASARRRATALARRARVEPVPVDPGACGRVLALAYPDRVAQARGNGRFRMRNGAGAWVPGTDPLSGEAFLVVADLDAGPRGGDARARLAAGLDAADVEAAAGAAVEYRAHLAWDAPRNDLRLLTQRRLGALVLGATEGPAPSGPATAAALLAQVRSTRLAVLGVRPAARALQARIAFARRVLGPAWPDTSDGALLAVLEEWLAPLLAGATGRADLERIDLARVLRGRLGPGGVAELERMAPPALAVPSGRVVALDYAGEQPAAAVRVQELFGLREHPAVAGGRVPVVLHLLSPAGRPVQVTSDLPGFWAGSWQAVRKEMAGRYPRHAWPADPATAAPPVRSRP